MFGIGLGPTEMMLFGILAVVLFGSRLPEVARTAGRSLTELRRSMRDIQDNFRDTMHEAEQAAKVDPIAIESDDLSSDEEIQANDQYTGTDLEAAVGRQSEYASTDANPAEEESNLS